MTNQFNNLRLRLAIRKAMLTLGKPESRKSELLNRFSWESDELKTTVVAELIAEGLLTEKQGTKGASILVWHDERVAPEVCRG